MKTIRLTQIDGKFPNLALMKLSHWHKSQGHDVVFERSIIRGMFEPDYEVVYGSAIFSTSEKKIAEFKRNFPNAIVGGTGTNDNISVEKIILNQLDEEITNYFSCFTEDEKNGEKTHNFFKKNNLDLESMSDHEIEHYVIAYMLSFSNEYSKKYYLYQEIEGNGYEHYDYDIYPDFDASIGFSQRGCRLRCKFCVVPEKEGKNKGSNTIYEIWQQNPRNKGKKIHLLDNDFFGQPNWQDKANEIIDGGYRVCFNQGINIRLIDEEGAAYLSRMKFRDDSFKTKRIYTAWDNKRDEAIFMKGINCILGAGIKPNEVMVYFLCNYWEKGLTDDVWHRFETMRKIGLLPYPMIYEKWTASRELKEFQEWVIRGAYRVTDFDKFLRESKNGYFKRKRREKMPKLF